MMGGTGQKLASAATIVAAAASLTAALASGVSIWLQTKNYRKPLLQRYVVRILLMVPIYSISSYVSMVSLTAAAFLDPVRDVYEAFTIYTFFQLLANYLGGERALIIMAHGREPVSHLWPLNYVLHPVDISDPHTFLAIKRGILQYAWIKPTLSIATILMKATGTYKEGYLSLDSGYTWTGLVYNISVSLSLYSLGLFWVCMHHDLQPFRPVPKFLCVKLIIFASWWQGFFLSILVWTGVIPDDVQGFSPDNLAVAIQDFLICIEMPAFAIAHWHAFSWHDFADKRIQAARMPIWYACRDAFGIRDLIEDSKETFKGDKYGYRIFDSGDKIMAHEASRSRLARLKDGMRYERGGKGKYWIPRPNEINQNTPLLAPPNGGPSHRRSESPLPYSDGLEEPSLDPDEESLYEQARSLEFGDWNYPVVTEPESASERLGSPHPSLFQTSPNASLHRRPSSNAAPSTGTRSNPDRRRSSASKSSRGTKKRDGAKSEENRSGESGSGLGKDPLQIAYGPVIGTNPQITEDDFGIEAASSERGLDSQSRGKRPDTGDGGPRRGDQDVNDTRPRAYGYDGDDDLHDNVWSR